MSDKTATPDTTTTTADGAAPRPRAWLALGAVAGPTLFTLAWFVLGFVSPGYEVGGEWISPYSAVSQPISGLGMGETAPYMTAAFVVGGLALLAGLIGAFQTVPDQGRRPARRTCLAALALSPLGLVLAGIFDIDHDLPHFLGFALAAGAPVVTFPLTGVLLRRVPAWRRFGTYLLAAGPLTLLLLVVYLVSFDEATTAANEGVAGLTSRVLATEVLLWFAAMGWLAWRMSGRRGRCAPDGRGAAAGARVR